ncbi:RodZ domain-containing protein [Halostreptopolyspora alba]|uniref:DUF4115 domain-containing protein n=1 Tax=Halostreptopolyspora alba TaxID=2487137 RepID=A0A3N0EDH0_9ACTN|nr:DUF4115 domain-containing protein [Nocardiopsaceae bacterium YIM 96095]
MAMASAAAVLVTLVALGGFFLYRSLPGNSDAVVAPESGAQADAQSQSDAIDSHALHIVVVGQSSEVVVRVPGGDVLTDTEMTDGEYVSYDQEELEVTIGEPSAVEVHVNGEPLDISDEDPGYSFTVERE